MKSKLIKDLGTRGNSVHSRRYYLVECTLCRVHFETQAAAAKNSKLGRCKPCGSLIIGPKQKPIKSMKEKEGNFIRKAIEIHKDSYDYFDVHYTGSQEHVNITCKDCTTTFRQSPNNHLKGRGCNVCANNRFNMTKPAILYFFNIYDVYKIGVTNKTLDKRYTKKDYSHMKAINTWQFSTGEEAYKYEQLILKRCANHRYKGTTPFTDGTSITECFTKDIKEEIDTLIKN